MLPIVRPRIVLSKCLELDACRYNGQMIPDEFVSQLLPHIDVLPVCPEVEIGLGTPRDPIRIISSSTGERLVQPTSSADLTVSMSEFSHKYAEKLEGIDGFILKSRSPSCGLRDVKIYSDTPGGMASGKRAGFFATVILEKFPDSAIEEEGRLRNFTIRESFLTRLYALALLRSVEQEGKYSDLVQFHAEYKLVMMAYNQTKMRLLGRMIAEGKKRPWNELLAEYRTTFSALFHRIPGYKPHINVLQHAFGYFSDELTIGEKRQFLTELERYRAGKIPLSVAQAILKMLMARYPRPYLEDQRYFAPYPEEFVSITDSGKGRDSR